MTKKFKWARKLEMKKNLEDPAGCFLILTNRQTEMALSMPIEDIRKILISTLHNWDINAQMFT